MRRPKRVRISRTFAIVAAAVAAYPFRSATAATDNWIGGNSDWNTPTNWDSGVVPGAGDTVNISNSDGFSSVVTYDYPGPAVTLGTLNIDATLNLTGSDPLSFQQGPEIIGVNGSGVLNQDGSVNTVNYLAIGQNPSSTGTYILSAGTLSAGFINRRAASVDNFWGEYIGYQGVGVFNQSGGLNVATVMQIGGSGFSNLNRLDGTGTYILSGTGSLSASAAELVGYGGMGNFIQTGGINTSGNVTVSSNSTENLATYSLSGGALSAGKLLLGDSIGSAPGDFTQTGGVLNAGQFYLFSGATFNQSGGQSILSNLRGNQFDLLSTGAISLTGGTMTLAPGGAVGTLGSLNIATGATFDMQINGSNPHLSYESLYFTEPSTLAGTLEIDLVNGFMPRVGDQFTLLTDSVPFTGGFSALSSNDPLLQYVVSYGQNSNQVQITITSIPEPAMMSVPCIAALMIRRHRRRQRKPSRAADS